MPYLFLRPHLEQAELVQGSDSSHSDRKEVCRVTKQLSGPNQQRPQDSMISHSLRRDR